VKGRPPKDRTGQVHGLLTAVRAIGLRSGNRMAWAWRCQCGAEVERAFQPGMVKSCGAKACRPPRLGAPSRPFIDLVGHRFGKLTALRYATALPGERGRWVCQCDCGAETAVRAQHLRSGATESCGCLNAAPRPRSAPRGVQPGHTYGLLTVEREVESLRGLRRFVCICECGGATTVLGRRLTGGDVKDCGCVKAARAAKRAERAAGPSQGVTQ
jgi:hypothetical protein